MKTIPTWKISDEFAIIALFEKHTRVYICYIAVIFLFRKNSLSCYKLNEYKCLI